MPIPDHIRRQAMDAVSHRETTDFIRSFQDSGIEAAPGFSPVEIPQGPTEPLTDEIRLKAMDAVSHSETMAAVRQVEMPDDLRPDHTPSVKNTIIAERIAEMHETGQSMGAIQQSMTKDNFGREHEIG